MNTSFFTYLFAGLLGFFSQVHPQPRMAQDSVGELYRLSSTALDNYDYENSIRYSLKLVDLAAKKKDYYHLCKGYNNLGITYEDRRDTLRAKDNYLKALDNAKASQNDTLIFWAYNNLAGIFTAKKETLQKGLDYYNKAIGVTKKLGTDFTYIPLINKGWTHLDYKQYDQAFPFLQQTLTLLCDRDNDYAMGQLLTLFGRYYTGKRDFDKAREYFDTSIGLLEKNSMLLEASDAYKAYSNMWLAAGNYEQAYLALDRHLAYQAKIFEEEKLHQMEAAYTRYETEEYRRNLERSEMEQAYKDGVIAKTKETNVIMVFFLVVKLVFLILLYRSNSIRKRLITQLRDKNTELLQAKEEAERLSLLKTRFFSTVSHELRTPLYGVVGLTSLLLEDNMDDKHAEDLKSLKFSADYLLALINDVLQMNKIESNLVKLENLPFSMKDLLYGIVKSFEFTRVQNNISLELQIDENIPENLIGDSVRLSQILMNLLGNAIKFTTEGKVWIKVKCNDSTDDECIVGFEVGDTGIGIPENKQLEIFEEFSQLRSDNYNYQGTGLGLSIVEKLLDLFGSGIEVESEEGKGSVFRFGIAFQKGQAPPDEREEMIDYFQPSYSKALIVDDNRINQIVTRRILEKQNFTCEIANDGFEAIAKIKSGDYDVVLMDVNMPGMNGMDTTREIRKFNLEIPVIALTAVEIGEMREEILHSGMNDIVVKPYDTQQLYHIVYRNLQVPV